MSVGRCLVAMLGASFRTPLGRRPLPGILPCPLARTPLFCQGADGFFCPDGFLFGKTARSALSLRHDADMTRHQTVMPGSCQTRPKVRMAPWAQAMPCLHEAGRSFFAFSAYCLACRLFARKSGREEGRFFHLEDVLHPPASSACFRLLVDLGAPACVHPAFPTMRRATTP